MVAERDAVVLTSKRPETIPFESNVGEVRVEVPVASLIVVPGSKFPVGIASVGCVPSLHTHPDSVVRVCRWLQSEARMGRGRKERRRKMKRTKKGGNGR